MLRLSKTVKREFLQTRSLIDHLIALIGNSRQLY